MPEWIQKPTGLDGDPSGTGVTLGDESDATYITITNSFKVWYIDLISAYSNPTVPQEILNEIALSGYEVEMRMRMRTSAPVNMSIVTNPADGSWLSVGSAETYGYTVPSTGGEWKWVSVIINIFPVGTGAGFVDGAPIDRSQIGEVGGTLANGWGFGASVIDSYGWFRHYHYVQGTVDISEVRWIWRWEAPDAAGLLEAQRRAFWRPHER